DLRQSLAPGGGRCAVPHPGDGAGSEDPTGGSLPRGRGGPARGGDRRFDGGAGGRRPQRRDLREGPLRRDRSRPLPADAGHQPRGPLLPHAGAPPRARAGRERLGDPRDPLRRREAGTELLALFGEQGGARHAHPRAGGGTRAPHPRERGLAGDGGLPRGDGRGGAPRDPRPHSDGSGRRLRGRRPCGSLPRPRGPLRDRTDPRGGRRKERALVTGSRRPMDLIELRKLRAECVVGVYPSERTHPQPLLVDLGLYFDARPAARGGGLSATIDYAKLAGEIRFLLSASRFYLLETAAEALAAYLLAPPTPDVPRARVQAVTIRLSKPKALTGSAIASLQIHREASEMDYPIEEKGNYRVDRIFED